MEGAAFYESMELQNKKRELFYSFQKSRNSKVKYSSFIRDMEKIEDLQSKIRCIKVQMKDKYGDFQ